MKNKVLIIITSVVILVPAIVGLLMWNILPESLAIHFDVNGNPDGWCGKAFAVFGLPLFALAMHLLSIFVTIHDPKYENTGRKIQSLVVWICPIFSVLAGIVTYSYSLNPTFSVLPILEGVLGIIIMIIGNYLPKCRQNYTIGIKLPWTLHDSENWNKTHRFAAKVWLIGGLVLTVNALISSMVISIAVILLLVLAPTVYSFAYSKTHR